MMAGAVMLLTGAAVYITGWIYAPYLYTVGAGMFAVGQLLDGYGGSNYIIKRLRKQQVFGALLLVVTALFMFTTHGNEWIACLTIAAILELYTSFRIAHEEEKDLSSRT